MGSKIQSIYNLTPLQKGLYYENMLAGNQGAYVLQNCFRVQGYIERGYLRQSLDLLSLKYEVLRSAVVMPSKSEQAFNVVLNDRRLELNVVDLSGLTEKEKEEAYQKYLREDVSRGFDLANDSLVRLAWLRRGPEDNIFIWTAHHIIVDGWSLFILFHDMMKYYSTLASGMSPEQLKTAVAAEHDKALQFQTYVKLLDQKDQAGELDYWARLLQDYSNFASILPSACGKAKETGDMVINLDVPDHVYRAIKRKAAEWGVSLSCILETCWGLVLQEYSCLDDVVFGKVVSGRDEYLPGVNEAVGLLINTVPVRFRYGCKDNIRDAVRNMQEQSVLAATNGHCPLADIQRGNRSQAQLFDTLFVCENYYVDKNFFDQAAKLKIEMLSFREQTSYPITFTTFESSDKLNLSVRFRARLYSAEDISIMLNHFVSMMQNLSAAEDKANLCGVTSLSTDERNMILHEFGRGPAMLDENETVGHLVEQQAALHPDFPAVCDKNRRLTYRDLNVQANRLAYRLIKEGVKRGNLVAIIGTNRVELIVGMLAIVKAGAAYLPIDPSMPDARIRFILNDAPVRLILTLDKEPVDAPVPLFALDDCLACPSNEQNPDIEIHSGDLLNCIYTSGTTGQPKGSLIEHRSVIRVVHNPNYVTLNQNTVMLQTVSISFDVSGLEIWGSLVNGGCLVMTDKDVVADEVRLQKIMRTEQVNTMWLTTSLFNQIIQHNPELFDGLNYLMVGGEQLSEKHIRMFLNTGTRTTVINGYGPTESAILTTSCRIPRHFEHITIGRPLRGTNIYIINKKGLCGVEIPGQLCIGGCGLSRGYLNRPELTAKSFVPNPYGEGRLYYSGDMARWLPDGNIDYMGRVDDQVKVRGYRVEPGEIENITENLPFIRQAAVTADRDSEGIRTLCLYYTADNEVPVHKVRDQLRNILPEYMVPAYLMQLERMPLTANGKINKKALPKILAHSENKYVAPRTKAETLICKIFGDILDVPRVGVKDNFFDLGGHSLRATRLVNDIEAKSGVRIALKDVFTHSTPEELALLMTGQEIYKPIPVAEKRDSYPMSSAQRRIYLVNRMDPSSLAYNMPQGFLIHGRLDTEKFGAALKEIIKRNEILRTSFEMSEGQFVQKILPEVMIDFSCTEDSSSDPKRLLRDFVRPFDFARPPLVRVRLVKRGPELNYLMLDMHHIISDGMSAGTFAKELITLCTGGSLTTPIRQYKDYSEWMRGRDMRAEEAFWKNAYKDIPSPLNLPLDYARPICLSYTAGTVGDELRCEVAAEMHRLEAETGTTDYMIFLSAFMLMLSQYSFQEDVVVGSPISARTHKDTESMLGMFVNTIAMRGRPCGQKRLGDFLREIKEFCLEAYENQEYPFEKLVEQLDLPRDFSRNPLFDVMMILQNNEPMNLNAPGCSIEMLTPPHLQAKFDLTLQIIPSGGGYHLDLEYAAELFTEKTARGMLSHFSNILTEMLSNLDRKIAELPLILPGEQTLLREHNRTESPYPHDCSVMTLFEAKVKEEPERIALVYQDKQLTYRALNEKANQIAHRLVSLGIGREDRVAVLAARGLEMVVAIYAVLKAGAAYVPIDPLFPKERISFILSDVQPRLILTYRTAVSDPAVPVLDLETLDFSTEAVTNLQRNETPSDLMYIIYTSGTTGRPKGLMIENRSIVNYSFMSHNNLLYEAWKHGCRRIASLASITFDISITEFFLSLLNGMTVYIADEQELENPHAFNSFVERNQIDILQTITSRLKMLMNEETLSSAFRMIRYVLVGGEKVTEKLVSPLLETGTVTIQNVYGPSETTVWSASYSLHDTSDIKYENIPIGLPTANVKMYVLQGERLCGPGIPGELCIVSPGLSRGYINLPEMTARAFVRNPFGGGLMYRSGDLVRWTQDGQLQYLDRIDQQVKIRGYRIELEEVRRNICEIDGVLDAAVIARPDNDGENALYAYLTSSHDLDIPELRKSIARILPQYMIPAYMMQIPEIPLNKNGKLDKKALPTINKISSRSYEAPQNEDETSICSLFESILNVSRVGRNDDFFQMGGHSLKAAHLVNEIEKDLHCQINLRDVFINPTPACLAAVMQKQAALIPMAHAEEKASYLMSEAQKRIFYVSQMDPEGIVYNMPRCLTLQGSVDPERMRDALRRVIADNEILRTAFVLEDGNAVQKILPYAEPELELVDAADRTQDALIADFVRPFDLSRPPLVRARLVKRPDDYLLFFDMHHIVADGTSMELFTRQFAAAYNNSVFALPEYQYKDYSEWRKNQNFDAARAYWDGIYDVLPEPLDLPVDFPRPRTQSYHGNTSTLQLDKKLSSAIHRTAEEFGMTEYMIFLAGLMILLSRMTQQDDIVVGSPVSGRTNSAVEDILGMFVNTIAMRAQPKADKTVRQFFMEIKKLVMDALEYQDYPFEDLIERLAIPRDPARSPLFDVMLAMQNDTRMPLRLEGIKVVNYDQPQTAAKYDLTFNIMEKADGFIIALDYCTDLYADTAVTYMLRHFRNILLSLTDSAEGKLADVNLLDSEEKNLLLRTFNDKDKPISVLQTPVQLFEEQAEIRPNQIALIAMKQSVTYAELNQMANNLAAKLISNNIGEGTIVAIMARRGVAMITAILAVLKAGGAYVPLDPDYPAERIRYILDDSSAALLLTTEDWTEKKIPTLSLNDDLLWHGSAGNPAARSTCNDLMYIIYTSGTSGRPKGVMLEQSGVLSLRQYFVDNHKLGPQDHVLQFANYVFDAFVSEFTMSLLTGATLCLINGDIQKDPLELAAYMRENNVSIAILPPSMLEQMELPELRTIITAGSETNRDLVIRNSKDRVYSNDYGPTETTVCATFWKHMPGEPVPAKIPIGRPINNKQVYILQYDKLAGVGIPGELCIGGVGLARGYINNPALTAEHFVKNPVTGRPMYRSGDRARWLPDGTIDYLGRIDQQIKVRGFRVEPAEVEQTLCRCLGIRDAAVLALPDETGEPVLAAYVVADRAVDLKALRGEIMKTLPAYMIPSLMMQIPSIPRNQSGKTDYKALPQIRRQRTSEYEAPGTEQEKLLCAKIAEVLGLERVGLNDNFFELGGDSIKAIRTVSELRALGYELRVSNFLRAVTIREISASLKKSAEAACEQGPAAGIVADTPIMESFRAWNLPKPFYFNQSVLLAVDDGTSAAQIRKAVSAVVRQHDILRAVWRDGTLSIPIMTEKEAFSWSEHNLCNEENAAAEAVRLSAAVQSGFNLGTGPLLYALLLHFTQGSYLWICAHHLVVDAFSWQIMMEDFNTALRQIRHGEEIKLPPKTGSFIAWSKLLREYRETQQLQSQRAYWEQTVRDAQTGRLDLSGRKGSGSGMHEVRLSWTAEQTADLYGKACHAFGTTQNELILATLSEAVYRLTGQQCLTVMMEGHGREELHKRLPIDRTVGWFTTEYPVVLRHQSSLETQVIETKETLRRIPQNGFGYGLLRKDVGSVTADVYYNYLGTFDDTLAENAPFKASADCAPENLLPGCLHINGAMNKGILRFVISCRRDEAADCTGEELAAAWHSALLDIVSYCLSRKEQVRTLSDSDADDLTEDDLALINLTVSRMKGNRDRHD